MERAELAARLVAADNAERVALLREYSAQADVGLAYVLKDICLGGWGSDPLRATGAAAALEALDLVTDDAEVTALAAWGAGIAALIDGQMERAVNRFETAASLFAALGKSHTAAVTEVSRLIPLSMLGRYDEAIECGLRAREVFIAHGDQLAAGKIEHNLGNLYFRRDRYQEAEQFQTSARDRYAALDDQKQLAEIENCLANTYSTLHKFRAAEQLYKQALGRAELAGLTVRQAEIEANMGNLALFQGRYDQALDYLERSRRKYIALGMRHQSAIAEQEIADAYLELNLAPEAAAIYERVIPTFAELGMRAEQARSLAQHGRAAILLGQTDKAHALLSDARSLYADEGNMVGEAMVSLTEAQLHYDEESYEEAGEGAAQAETPLASAGTWRRALMARWLRGEVARAQKKSAEARSLLEATLADALLQGQPQVAERCLTSLGLLAAMTGDRESAEDFFKRAVAFIEDLRAPLPAEEFRTAYFSDKLVPYDELVRLCLTDKRNRVAEALCFVERARSRALVDTLGGALKFLPQPRDPFEAELMTRLEELQEELNWFYSQINRPTQNETTRSRAEMATLHQAVRERETKTLEIMRQLQHRGDPLLTHVETLDIEQLQRNLGPDTALVEYTSLDAELLAFIVTDEKIEVLRHLGGEEEAGALLEQFRFQIEALRYGAERMRRHLPNLTSRVRHHLQSLYELLLRRVEERIGTRRLVVVPHRALHYIPFHALHDGEAYVIERREVSYSPSASVLRHCLSRTQHPLERALLLGVSDERTPRVRDEVKVLAPLFPTSTALLDESATLAAVRAEAPRADIIHLACHGQFRPDNPLFSSLRLGDGWLTVRDAYGLNLRCNLVALSACETGVSAVAPGDELIGLARGFFSAGAPSLLLSLWAVDDEATATLMLDFYTRLREGEAPAAALRFAQLQLLKQQPHPFFWSPFVLMGRW
ncbi:MAG TPA: CHAT domain-containing tetratricopeptide repeat protein [Pyrinomonadaceae bacterium]|jgi:CHAT domain-containing protein|nr:CHAT domain-containing tetratricopeptide repeat protein [Pyrinomonadaceae bacterium]